MAEHWRVELEPAVEVERVAQPGVDVTGQCVEGKLGAFLQIKWRGGAVPE